MGRKAPEKSTDTQDNLLARNLVKDFESRKGDKKMLDDAGQKVRDNIKGVSDMHQNLDNAMSKLKGYSSQVTPGDFKSKDCIDGKC